MELGSGVTRVGGAQGIIVNMSKVITKIRLRRVHMTNCTPNQSV